MVQKSVKHSGLFMLLLSLAFMMVLTTGCQEAKLKAVVKIANQQCPMNLGDAGKITSIVFDGKNVVYSFHVNETYTDINALKSNPESLKLSVKTMFQNPAPDVKKMLELMVESNAGLQMVYIGEESNDQITCELTAAELKEVLNTDISAEESNIAKLETQVKMANLQFPMQASEDILIEKVEIGEEAVIYTCKVDESIADMKLIKRNADATKQEMVSTLASQTDPVSQKFYQCCVNCDKGITYRYIGNTSGTQYDMVITLAELKGMIVKK